VSFEKPRSREWDASSYHRVSGPQTSWGAKVLARMDLRGDETVLDAGCGTGRLTASLRDLLPRGRVIGLDLSENMLRQARTHLLSDPGARVGFVCSDLVQLPFSKSIDVVFSTASFHWVLDHRLLFRSIFGALRPGGWLVAQCGGAANLQRFRAKIVQLSQEAPFGSYLGKFEEPWLYSDSHTAAKNLSAAGFGEVETGIEAAPTRFKSAEQFSEFVRTAIVHKHLNLLPTDRLKRDFVQTLTAQAGSEEPALELDYLRLNIRARKPA
jgi:trans-aconitate 2-methyltransferase